MNQSKQKSSEGQIPIWPSERIPQGGLFHTPKVEYCKETADLIRLLVKESKMSMLMRKQVDNSLRNGTPLPKPEPPRINTKNDPDKETLEILRRARNSKRKSLTKILDSGAYELSYYRPPANDRQPGEKAKAELQQSMCGMYLPDPALTTKRRRKPKTEEREITEADIINELLDQINERTEWLSEMEALGQGKKYRNEIRDQISQRLRHIQALETKVDLKKKGFRYVD